MIPGYGPAWIEALHVPLVQMRHRRPLVEVELPDRLITTSTGDVVAVSDAAFAALRDSMIGPTLRVDVPSHKTGPHGEMLHPYAEQVIYVPVLLPSDVTPAEGWPDTIEELR